MEGGRDLERKGGRVAGTSKLGLPAVSAGEQVVYWTKKKTQRER